VDDSRVAACLATERGLAGAFASGNERHRQSRHPLRRPADVSQYLDTRSRNQNNARQRGLSPAGVRLETISPPTLVGGELEMSGLVFAAVSSACSPLPRRRRPC